MSVVEATLEPTSGSQPLRDLVGELQKACKDIGDLGASLLLLRKWFTVISITVRFTEVSTGLYDSIRGGQDLNTGDQVLGLLRTTFLNEYVPGLFFNHARWDGHWCAGGSSGQSSDYSFHLLCHTRLSSLSFTPTFTLL